MTRRTTFLVSALLVALVSACSSTSSSPSGTDGGSDAIVSPSCPTALPAEGSACASAVSCPYGEACNETIAVCVGGFWQNSHAALGDGGACPMTAPDPGGACSLCASAPSCRYNQDCDLDGGVSTTATCKGGNWSVATVACALEGGSSDTGASDSGSSDGGADSSDAESDAHTDAGDASGDGGDAGTHD